MTFRFLLLLVVAGLATGCNLEREVEIDLPGYSQQPVVECYLEPGQPYRLLLTRAFGYFETFDIDDPSQALIGGATVVIRHGNSSVVLNNSLFFDPQTRRFANYVADELVPADPGTDFTLDIVLPDGETITASTTMLPLVPIDSLVVEANPDTMYRVLTFFTEDLSTNNYYRRMLHFGSLDSLEQDFLVEDDFFDTDLGVFGMAYSLVPGDTSIHTLVHIDATAFHYFNTVQQSIGANLNPFGQPGLIESNLQGTADAMGIFTGLQYERDTVIIE